MAEESNGGRIKWRKNIGAEEHRGERSSDGRTKKRQNKATKEGPLTSISRCFLKSIKRLQKIAEKFANAICLFRAVISMRSCKKLTDVNLTVLNS